MENVWMAIITSLINNVAPIVISAITTGIAVKYNGYLNLKKQELTQSVEHTAIRNVLDAGFSKIELNKHALDFINETAMKAIKVAEEKALQSWKDTNEKEIVGKQKHDIAVDYVKKNVEGIIPESFVDLIPSIVDSVLSEHRPDLDSVYSEVKKDFVVKNGYVPNNSRNPFSGSDKPSIGKANDRAVEDFIENKSI